MNSILSARFESARLKIMQGAEFSATVRDSFEIEQDARLFAREISLKELTTSFSRVKGDLLSAKVERIFSRLEGFKTEANRHSRTKSQVQAKGLFVLTPLSPEISPVTERFFKILDEALVVAAECKKQDRLPLAIALEEKIEHYFISFIPETKMRNQARGKLYLHQAGFDLN